MRNIKTLFVFGAALVLLSGLYWSPLGAQVAGILTANGGRIALLSTANIADDVSNNSVFQVQQGVGTAGFAGSAPLLFDGSTWDRMRGNSAGGAFVQGPAAAGAAVAGNPLYMGGVGNGGLTQAVRTCANTTGFTAAAAATTLLLTGVSAQSVFICNMSVSLDAAGTFSLISGTGATCGTGTTTVLPAMTLAVGVPLAWGSGLGVVIRGGAAGDSICAVTTGVGAAGHGSLAFAIIP